MHHDRAAHFGRRRNEQVGHHWPAMPAKTDKLALHLTSPVCDHRNSRLGEGNDQLSEAGPRWRTWHRMINANRAPWYGFGSACGERGFFATSTGPLGRYPGKKTPPSGW